MSGATRLRRVLLLALVVVTLALAFVRAAAAGGEECAAPTGDPYAVLGVSQGASKEEVTKAYRKLARQWHPDRHVGSGEQEVAAKAFTSVAHAYEVRGTAGPAARARGASQRQGAH